MTVIRRLDAVLEPTKEDVLKIKGRLDKAGVANPHAALCQASGHAFYNTSSFCLRDLPSRGKRQQLRADFEELIRRFNEENNEEAGEHFTPRDVVALMAHLILMPIAEEIRSGTYLVYDGACGTGGMLAVAEETLVKLNGAVPS